MKRVLLSLASDTDAAAGGEVRRRGPRLPTEEGKRQEHSLLVLLCSRETALAQHKELHSRLLRLAILLPLADTPAPREDHRVPDHSSLPRLGSREDERARRLVCLPRGWPALTGRTTRFAVCAGPKAAAQTHGRQEVLRSRPSSSGWNLTFFLDFFS